MISVSTLLVRTSLLFLVAGFALGGVLLSWKGFGGAPTWVSLVPAHFRWVLVGWMFQFALGVAYWIFPRIDGSRGRTGVGIAAWSSLNAGVLVATLPDFAALVAPVPGLGFFHAAGSALSLIGIATLGAGLFRRAGHVPPGLEPNRAA